MNQKSEVFVYEKFLSEEGLRAAPEHLFIREVRISTISQMSFVKVTRK